MTPDYTRMYLHQFAFMMNCASNITVRERYYYFLNLSPSLFAGPEHQRCTYFLYSIGWPESAVYCGQTFVQAELSFEKVKPFVSAGWNKVPQAQTKRSYPNFNHPNFNHPNFNRPNFNHPNLNDPAFVQPGVKRSRPAPTKPSCKICAHRRHLTEVCVYNPRTVICGKCDEKGHTARACKWQSTFTDRLEYDNPR